MVKIKIDDIEYDTEEFTDNGKAQLASLQFIEAHMKKINAEIAVYKTAKASYGKALKAELEKT
ncbi:DUF6447 family protein [Tateyamaria pelophila]|uniref:DUF6447 family protein n=1 Tax=Tateyamaria pelophila TaxID=328415 RepID=UPI001CBE7359|nr:DUF6447 family protein [Tateyamaria pelophila]